MADQAFWPLLLGFLMGASLVAIFAILSMQSLEQVAMEALLQAVSACKETE